MSQAAQLSLFGVPLQAAAATVFKCSYCNGEFKKKNGLTSHLQHCKKNPANPPGPPAFQPKTCDCDEKDCRAGKLWDHAGSYTQHAAKLDRLKAAAAAAAGAADAADAADEDDEEKKFRKSYQLRYKLRVLDYLDLDVARNPNISLSQVEKERIARTKAMKHFNLPDSNVRNWWQAREALRARPRADAAANKLVDSHSAKFPVAESQLRSWMVEQRRLERILDRAAITAKFKSLVAAEHGAAAAGDFKFSRWWFASCMTRIGFSWRAITRKASQTLGDQLPTMTMFVAKLSRRMNRAARKQATAISKEADRLSANGEIAAAQALLAPRFIARDVNQPLLVKGELHLIENETESYRLFNDRVVQGEAARGLLSHPFGIGPWARFNVDQVPIHFGINATHTYDAAGVSAVPATGLHNEHKESRDATLQVCINGSGVVALQPRLMILLRGTGKKVKQNEQARYDEIEARGELVVRFQAKAWMTDEMCLQWIEDVYEPFIGGVYREYLGLDATEATTKLLQVDGLSGQTNESFQSTLWEQTRTKTHISPAKCTHKLQPIDNGVGNEIKRIACGPLLQQFLEDPANLERWSKPPKVGGFEAWEKRALLVTLCEKAWVHVKHMRAPESSLSFIARCFVATGSMIGVNNYWADKITTLLPDYKKTRKGERYATLILPAVDAGDDSIDGETLQAYHRRVSPADSVVDADARDRGSAPRQSAPRPSAAAAVEEAEEDEEIEFEDEVVDGEEEEEEDDDDAAATVMLNAVERRRERERVDGQPVPPIGARIVVLGKDTAFELGDEHTGIGPMVGQHVMLLVAAAGRASRSAPAVWREATTTHVATAVHKKTFGVDPCNYIVKWRDDGGVAAVCLRNNTYGTQWVLLAPAPDLIHVGSNLTVPQCAGGPEDDVDPDSIEGNGEEPAMSSSSTASTAPAGFVFSNCTFNFGNGVVNFGVSGTVPLESAATKRSAESTIDPKRARTSKK